jgi:ligand-binding sensor domain-containing protein
MSVIALGLSGCDAARLQTTPRPAVTATPTATRRIAVPVVGNAGADTPAPPPTNTPDAAATPELATFTITDEPVQSWTDPNDVTALLHDGTSLWATTNGGLVRWQTQTGEYRIFTPDDGLASQAIRGLALDGDGHLWVGYVDHPSWSEYDGQTWHTYESREQAVEARYTAMLAATHQDPRLWSVRSEGTWLWLLAADGRAKVYDGTEWIAFGERQGMAPGSRFILAADDKFVWAVGDSLNVIEEGLLRWRDHSMFAGVAAGSTITDVIADQQGRIWVAFAGPSDHLGGGLACYDPSTGRWLGYRHAHNPTLPKHLYDLELDPEGTLWASGDGGVAFRRLNGPWELLPFDEVVTRSFCRDAEGRLWLGTTRGLWSAAPNGKDLRGPWLIPSPLIGNQVTALLTDDQDRLWVGTDRGVSMVGDSGETKVILNEPVLSINPDPDGSIWLATQAGLYYLEQDGSPQQILEEPIIAMDLDATGSLWVCTAEGHLRRRTDGEWTEVAQVGQKLGVLPVDMVVSRDSRVWFATPQGLGVRSPEGEFSLLGIEDGLLHQDVRALALGPDDTLWIATLRGLARIAPDGKWTRFTTESTEGGLRSMELLDVQMDDEGTLWIATKAGISSRTANADWSYVDLFGARMVWPQPGSALWVGTQGGLYRLDRSLLTPVP